jgi:hypothetical protein
VIAAIAVGAVVLGDALRHRASGGGRATTAATTVPRGTSTPRLTGLAAPGLVAYTVPGACELRAFDLRSSRAIGLPRLPTTCELSAPRVGTHVAYSVGDSGGAKREFRIRDLAHPRAASPEYASVSPFAWSADGSRLGWCDTPESGFDLPLGRRPRRLDSCPRAYDPRGETASVTRRGQVVVDGRPLLTVGGVAWDLGWGVDGSLAVLVNGRRVDRYEGGRPAGGATLPLSMPANPITMRANLAPDNCAALTLDADVVRLVNLGCFRGRAPRTFRGVFADWSPDGTWIAAVEQDAVVFHRVVGPEATVRWNVSAGQLAWLGG